MGAAGDSRTKSGNPQERMGQPDAVAHWHHQPRPGALRHLESHARLRRSDSLIKVDADQQGLLTGVQNTLRDAELQLRHDTLMPAVFGMVAVGMLTAAPRRTAFGQPA